MKKRLTIILITLIFSGCSVNFLPYMRNMTNMPISIRITSLQNIPNEIDDIEMYWTSGIQNLDNINSITFTDTSKVKMINSSTGSIELPANSTSIVLLPLGWKSENYLVTAERSNGQIDTLNRNLKYNLIRNGKPMYDNRLHRNDRIYYDFK